MQDKEAAKRKILWTDRTPCWKYKKEWKKTNSVTSQKYHVRVFLFVFVFWREKKSKRYQQEKLEKISLKQEFLILPFRSPITLILATKNRERLHPSDHMAFLLWCCVLMDNLRCVLKANRFVLVDMMINNM